MAIEKYGNEKRGLTSFGIVDFYLRTCRTCVIRGHIQPGLRIMDIGKPDALAEASRLLRAHSSVDKCL